MTKTLLFGGSGFFGPVILSKDKDIISVGRTKPPLYCQNQHIQIKDLDELKKLNLEIYNIDTTIICENPKINPFRDQILKKISLLLQVPTSRIGLKATTSEKIGIIGKYQAIAVQSLVNLRDKV